MLLIDKFLSLHNYENLQLGKPQEGLKSALLNENIDEISFKFLTELGWRQFDL